MSAKLATFPRNPDLLPASKLTDSELADQYGEVNRRYQACYPRRKECIEELQKRTEGHRIDESKLFDGKLWRTVVGAKGYQTTLPSMAAIHRMYRAARKDFYAAVKITLERISEDLGKGTVEKLKIRQQTGYRAIDAQLQAQPKAS